MDASMFDFNALEPQSGGQQVKPLRQGPRCQGDANFAGQFRRRAAPLVTVRRNLADWLKHRVGRPRRLFERCPSVSRHGHSNVLRQLHGFGRVQGSQDRGTLRFEQRIHLRLG